MKKKIISIILASMMVVTMLPMQVSAASTAKMTAFNQVYKTKNIAYCAGVGGVYKVTLKNGKVKKVKKLFKGKVIDYDYGCAEAMKKKGDYLYFMARNESAPGGRIYRVNVKTGKKKALTGFVYYLVGYVIKDKKIYYSYDVADDDAFYEEVKSMSLNGKNKKKSSMKVSMNTKNSNAKGYYIIEKEKDGYLKDYLRTPKGKYYLGKRKIEDSF